MSNDEIEEILEEEFKKFKITIQTEYLEDENEQIKIVTLRNNEDFSEFKIKHTWIKLLTDSINLQYLKSAIRYKLNYFIKCL